MCVPGYIQQATTMCVPGYIQQATTMCVPGYIQQAKFHGHSFHHLCNIFHIVTNLY